LLRIHTININQSGVGNCGLNCFFGDFNGRNLEVKEGEFHASSSASISAMVSQKASAQASSSGDVNLKKLGNPVISSSESSSGSVNIN
jgi:hypothetical protein